MTFQIIIKGKNNRGHRRSEQEENLRKEGFSTMDDSMLDRLRYVEKVAKDKTGYGGRIPQALVQEEVKDNGV